MDPTQVFGSQALQQERESLALLSRQIDEVRKIKMQSEAKSALVSDLQRNVAEMTIKVTVIMGYTFVVASAKTSSGLGRSADFSEMSKLPIPDELDGVVQVLAFQHHEVWARDKMADGWCYSGKRDNDAKEHPMLLPFFKLPLEDKKWDLQQAKDGIRLILASGYKIRLADEDANTALSVLDLTKADAASREADLRRKADEEMVAMLTGAKDAARLHKLESKRRRMAADGAGGFGLAGRARRASVAAYRTVRHPREAAVALYAAASAYLASSLLARVGRDVAIFGILLYFAVTVPMHAGFEPALRQMWRSDAGAPGAASGGLGGGRLGALFVVDVFLELVVLLDFLQNVVGARADARAKRQLKTMRTLLHPHSSVSGHATASSWDLVISEDGGGGGAGGGQQQQQHDGNRRSSGAIVLKRARSFTMFVLSSRAAAFDLLGSFPYAVVGFAAAASSGGSAASPGVGVILLKMLHLFKAGYKGRLSKAVRQIEKAIPNPQITRMTSTVVLFVVALHWMSCTYWLVRRYEPFVEDRGSDADAFGTTFSGQPVNERRWRCPPGLFNSSQLGVLDGMCGADVLEKANLVEQYTTAFYWALLSMVGSDMLPNSITEAVFTIIVSLTGVFLVAAIIGVFSSLVTHLDAHEEVKHQHMRQMDSFLKSNQVQPALRDQIQDFYEFTWNNHTAAQAADIFHKLPPILDVQLQMALKEKLVYQNTLFQRCDYESTVALVRRLHNRVAIPNEIVISTAGVANRLFFVLVGELTAFQEIAGMVDDHLTYIEASHFGIEAYFSGAGRNEFSVRATKYCTLEALSFEDIDELAEMHADFELQLRAAANAMGRPYLRGADGAGASTRDLNNERRRLSMDAVNASQWTVAERQKKLSPAGKLQDKKPAGRFKKLATAVQRVNTMRSVMFSSRSTRSVVPTDGSANPTAANNAGAGAAGSDDRVQQLSGSTIAAEAAPAPAVAAANRESPPAQTKVHPALTRRESASAIADGIETTEL